MFKIGLDSDLQTKGNMFFLHVIFYNVEVIFDFLVLTVKKANDCTDLVNNIGENSAAKKHTNNVHRNLQFILRSDVSIANRNHRHGRKVESINIFLCPFRTFNVFKAKPIVVIMRRILAYEDPNICYCVINADYG